MLENAELNIWMDTADLDIESSLNDIIIMLNNINPNMNIDNSVGNITVSLLEDPENLKLILNNIKLSVYSLPESWKENIRVEKPEIVIYEKGIQENTINATNKIGHFAIETRKASNIAAGQNGLSNTMPKNNNFINLTPPKNKHLNAGNPESYADINLTSYAKNLDI